MSKVTMGSASSLFSKQPLKTIRILLSFGMAAALILAHFFFRSRRGFVRGKYPAHFLYPDVGRSYDGTLFMAYYFPQYHIAPENILQLQAYGMNTSAEETRYYTDWDVIRRSQGFRSFTPRSFYNLADVQVYDAQDHLASKYDVGVFIFYHYLLDDMMVVNLPIDLFMQRRRKTKFLLCRDSKSGGRCL